jgi:hypothetical protein
LAAKKDAERFSKRLVIVCPGSCFAKKTTDYEFPITN